MSLLDVLIVSVRWQAKWAVFILLHISVGIVLMIQPRQEVGTRLTEWPAGGDLLGRSPSREGQGGMDFGDSWQVCRHTQRHPHRHPLCVLFLNGFFFVSWNSWLTSRSAMFSDCRAPGGLLPPETNSLCLQPVPSSMLCLIRCLLWVLSAFVLAA